MKQFEHLSIFVSLIIALGFRHLILCFVSLINYREKIKIYFPTIIWMVFLMLLQLLIWWVLFYQHNTTNWMFYKFLLYLVIPIVVSMLGHLIVPSVNSETNLLESYYHNRNWFFGLLSIIAFIGITQGRITSASSHYDLDFLFQIILFVITVFGFFIKQKRFQLTLALTFLIWIVTYISIFFTRLG
jgi:hypothetical protein